MPDARQLFAYTFYVMAFGILIAEQITSIRTIRHLRKKYPNMRRPRWYSWRIPGEKEARRDPEYRRMEWMHWVYWIVFVGCILAAQYTLRLAGTTPPGWLQWFHP